MRYKTLFQYRKLLMGFAMLLLIVHHGRGFLPPGRLNNLVAFFYGGVDFFLFCSGIGCFFSYTSDRDPVAFLKRRAARIFPVYLVYMAYYFRRGGVALPDVLGNLLCVQWLTGREPVFNWYMSALLVTYLLTPVFASLAERADTRPKAVGMLLLMLLFSCAFFNSEQWVIITTRIPLFFTGMLFAAESRRRDALSRREIAALLLLMAVGLGVLWKVHAVNSETLLWDYGMYWYPFLLIIPGASVLLAMAAQLLGRVAPGRWLLTAVGFVGGYTFELFITHCYALGHGPLHYLLYLTLYAAALHLASLAFRKALALAGRLFRAREKVS